MMGQNWLKDVSNYPRPQFKRDHWMSLDGSWNFCFDDEHLFVEPREIQKWPLKINVPFAPESKQSGIEDNNFHRHFWYQREFELRPKGKTILHFGAVDYVAKVWVNDRFAGIHEGGSASFSFEITHLLNESGQQKISVYAEDDPRDLAKPRGKQDWHLEPHSIWYPRTSGIWQSVWLEQVSETFIDRIRWTPHLERWEIGFEAYLSGDMKDGTILNVKLTANDLLLVQDAYQVIAGEVHRRIALSDPGIDDFRNELLWSPEKPTLIHAEIELIEDGKVIDRVLSYTALRSVDIQNEHFLLNGRPYYLKLVLDQGYWPETLMTAPSTEALKLDVELTKKMGFNGVRKHQKIEDPRYLFWADCLGLLVWEEMPSAYRFTHDSVERLTKEWIDIIDRDYNHPCIVTWVPFNESWGVPDLAQKPAHRNCVKALYHLTKTLDPTRPVVGNDGWENSATDIVGIHDYENVPESLQKRYGLEVKFSDLVGKRSPAGRQMTIEGYAHTGQALMLTEFGGIALNCDKKKSKNWGYSVCATSAEFRDKYKILLETIHQLKIFSGFCYTQLTDTFQETNGLLYADRTPKFSIDEIAKATRGPISHVNDVDRMDFGNPLLHDLMSP